MHCKDILVLNCISDAPGIGHATCCPADDFKMVVVEAIRALCLKFPAKHRSLMNFLSNILREEGGFEYKKSIVNAILALIQVCWTHSCWLSYLLHM